MAPCIERSGGILANGASVPKTWDEFLATCRELKAKNVAATPYSPFWTQQFQAFGAYYFDNKRARALIVTGTYNLNSKSYSKDLTPGQSMTLEYALSQFLSSRIEVGVCGYDQWQISPDKGKAARNTNVFYQIHAIGGQFTGWIIKEKLSFTAKCYYEYYGVDRFKGILGTANLIYVF